MKKNSSPVTLHDDKRATEFLANERTFLAWIRTSIAVISLGFVVAKFSVWLRELAMRLAPQMRAPENGASMPIGVSVMALGGPASHSCRLEVPQGESCDRAWSGDRRPRTSRLGNCHDWCTGDRYDRVHARH